MKPSSEPGKILFIADCHLSSCRPRIIEQFASYVLGLSASEVKALYILGDLFDVWIGDEYPDACLSPAIDALRQTSGEIPIYFIRGNRDFLTREKSFKRLSGCKILPEHFLLESHGLRMLLMHGDELSTNDLLHRVYRKLTRSSLVSGIFRGRHFKLWCAEKMRKISRWQNTIKSEHTMQVCQEEVVRLMKVHDAEVLIHGHTHQPCQHNFFIDNKSVRRIVLGDWYKTGQILALHGNGRFTASRLPYVADSVASICAAPGVS